MKRKAMHVYVRNLIKMKLFLNLFLEREKSEYAGIKEFNQKDCEISFTLETLNFS